MQIICPACDAIYEVPDSRLRPGLFLRCHRCQHEWPAVPPPQEAALAEPQPAAAMATEPTDAGPGPGDLAGAESAAMGAATRLGLTYPPGPVLVERPRAANPARRGGAGLMLAWIVSFALLAGAGWAAGVWHRQIVTAWPPAQRLYTVLGVPNP